MICTYLPNCTGNDYLPCSTGPIHDSNIKCCWRESVKPLLYYCNTIPISYFIDQRWLTFWYKIQNSNNTVLRTLSSLKHYETLYAASWRKKTMIKRQLIIGIKHNDQYILSLTSYCQNASVLLQCSPHFLLYWSKKTNILV